MDHAILSVSGSSKWLTCTPSVRLEKTVTGGISQESSYAKEGTLAHHLCELLIKQKLGQGIDSKLFKEITENEFYSETMYDHCEDFAVFVLEKYNSYPDASKMILLEKKLDLSAYIPEGFGTGDVQIIIPGTVEIIDFKYGQGVYVEAKDNKQLMLYGLGSYLENDWIYGVQWVKMTIYQPRLDNISSFEMSVDDLLAWANTDLKTKAKAAYEGVGDFVPGTHCQFCEAKPVCKSFADYNLQLAKYEFQDPERLNDLEIANIINKSKLFINWINAVEEHAITQAREGKKLPNLKLVEGRSNRKYVDENEVISILEGIGFKEEEIIQKNIYGITELSQRIGKHNFDKFVSPKLVKPAGKPTLVPLTDKRPELGSIQNAIQDFS